MCSFSFCTMLFNKLALSFRKDYLAMKEKEKEEMRVKKLHRQLDNDVSFRIFFHFIQFIPEILLKYVLNAG